MVRGIIFLLLLSISTSFSQEKIVNKYVNPFIGTANGGNTFPGAVVPWGMVSMSPHNSPGSPSGYIYGEKYFYGFGCVHLSGTGCSDLGSIIFTAYKGKESINPEQYKQVYSKETASPGYYSVYLPESRIKTEVSATLRCGIIKYTSEDTETTNILIDAGRNLSIVGGGAVRIISGTEIEGYNISGGFCGEDNRQKVYFYAQFSIPSESSRLWQDSEIMNAGYKSTVDTSIGCLMKYKIMPSKPLIIRIGISYVNSKNARENLESELSGLSFSEIKEKAENLWENYLSRIVVSGNENNKIKFYTALYHMLIHPNIISDVNGEYPLMGRKGIGKYKDRFRYSVFSLWDTYRTLHPFLTLVYPERQSEIVKTMIDMYKENGYLPKWELAGNETYMMVGDPATPVIADSYLKGIKDFDINQALDAMLKPALLKSDEKAPPIRAGYHELLKYGYIPFEQDTSEAWWVWGPVSTTLEYCFSDWAISQLSKSLDKNNYYNLFLKRSLLYKNLFDTSSLFMRPKLKNGSWLTPFNPLVTEGSGSWGGSGGPGYVEGNAWNYTWSVPYDIPGLIELFNNDRAFGDKLLKAFSEGYFTINNEPDIFYPYLFTYVKGKEHLTRELISRIIDTNFGTGADGLPGNDDCGTISGWFAFSSLGFYPVCPASNEYRIGIPLFDKVVLKLNQKYFSGKEIVIEKKRDNFNEVVFNNKKLGYSIEHSELVKGGELIFK